MPSFCLSFSIFFCFCSPFFIISSSPARPSSSSSSIPSPSDENSVRELDMAPPPAPPARRISRFCPHTTYIHTEPENFKETVQRYTAMDPADRVSTTTTIAAPSNSNSIGLRRPPPFSQNAASSLEIMVRGGGISCGKLTMPSPVSPFQLFGHGSPTNSSTPTPGSSSSAPALAPPPPAVDDEEEQRQVRNNGSSGRSKRPKLLHLFPLRPGSQTVLDDGDFVLDDEEEDDI